MGSDHLSPAQSRTLHRLAGIMIPADAGYGVPAANDDRIFADIVKSLGRDRTAVIAVLDALGPDFTALPDAEAEVAAMRFLDSGHPALSRAVLQCYYRDDRVLHALGIEPRAPFPKGNVVPQGDWSLLDEVKQRAPFWRDDRSAQ
jgi:hypothetical protein